MGKPISDEAMKRYVPNSLQCPFCFELNDGKTIEMRLEGEVFSNVGVVVFRKESYVCKCGKEIMSVTAKE